MTGEWFIIPIYQVPEPAPGRSKGRYFHAGGNLVLLET